jgi:hypothetical protein
MIIDLKSITDISKLLAFIRGGSRGEFRIDAALLKEVIEQVQALAKQHGIDYRIVTPSEDRGAIFTAAGAIAGAAAGYAVASVPGAIVGGVAGGFAGYCCSHIELNIARRADGDFSITLQPA